MKMHLRKRAVRTSKPLHLFRILNDIWNELPNYYVEPLVASVPKRSRIVYELMGGSTKY